MRKIASYILLAASLLFIQVTAYCQQTPYANSISINTRANVLYSGELNHLTVVSGIDSIRTRTLIIKASQGKLHNQSNDTFFNGLLTLDNLQDGMVTIGVFRKTTTGLELLKSTNFHVITLSPEEKKLRNPENDPVITMEGYAGGEMPLSVAQHATQLNVNKPYRVTGMVVYFFGSGYTAPHQYHLLSSNFDLDVINAMQHLLVGVHIVMDEIVVIDSQGKYALLAPISFSIHQ